MPSGKKLYSYVDVDDNTPVQKLKLSDQFRLLLRKLTEDPANELKADDAVTAEYLRLRADLTEFIRKASEPLKLGKNTEVVVQISNAFKPVLKDVLSSPEIRNYYKIQVAAPKIDYDIDFEYLLSIKLRKDDINKRTEV